MRERYQGGSLAGFIIIGVVLALVLVGGLYGLNRYNAEQTKEVATDQGSDSNRHPNDKTTTDNTSDSKDKNSDSKTEEQKPADTPESSDSEEATANEDESAGELPATGPADVVGATLAVFALSFATMHYMRSRVYRSR